MKTYIITGRVPDGDNETLWFQAESYADAMSKFIKGMHIDEPERKKEIVDDHGVAVYLDNVTEVTGEFDVHLSAGWQEMSEEAKKYTKRKTAYQR
jgi:uncharacterized protein YgfB (UPF0149 family)